MSEIILSDTTIHTSLAKYGKMEIIHQLAMISGYEEKVPDIETFIFDNYYLGRALGNGIYPIWLEAAKELFPSPYNCEYNTVVLTGGIGLGKSTMALLITLYDLCKMLCLKNPHQYYNLLESTVISFALMNATKSLASSVLMGQIVEWIMSSAFFKSKLAPKHNRTMFIKNIDITIGSRARDMLGQATVSAIFSEFSDMTAVAGQAEDNLDAVSTRRISRFGGKGKPINGRLILDSSNKGNRSFLDARIEENEKNGGKDFKIFSFSHWEAKMHLGGYSGETFQVYAGDENRDPFIVSDENRVLLATLKTERLINVPVEHRTEFNNNIIKSLRDLAGVSTYSTFSYITSNEVITRVFNRLNPVTMPIIVLDFFDEKQRIENYLDVKMCTFLNKSPRFIHIDLGIKWDSTGIACSYQNGYTNTERFDPLTGKLTINREPKFCVEWVMEIRAIPGQEVAIYKIREFLLFAKRLGYPIHTVSTDGYQSTGLRQDLTLKGIKTELISVDRNKDPYTFMRNAILENRIEAPKSEKLMKEIKDLQEGDQKFDHPDDSSKDLVDAMCGSIWSCSQSIVKSGTVVDSSMLLDNLNVALGASKGNKLLDTLSNGF